MIKFIADVLYFNYVHNLFSSNHHLYIKYVRLIVLFINIFNIITFSIYFPEKSNNPTKNLFSIENTTKIPPTIAQTCVRK